jgi:hypothetical protein
MLKKKAFDSVIYCYENGFKESLRILDIRPNLYIILNVQHLHFWKYFPSHVVLIL